MDRLRDLVGVERSVTGVSQALHLAVVERHPPTVGAMHITCADESENECVQAFLKGFVQYVVPPLKFGERSAVRIANLGGRYEWGAIRIAEQHYALVETGGAGKLLVVKVNAHVAGQRERGGDTFGVLKRYASDSPCCGALHGLLTGDHSPYVESLRDTFASEGRDRVATLLDEDRVAPRYRSLFAAIVSARLQARKVVLDIQDYSPRSPTQYLVVPCVTINREQRDTEIVCGFYSTHDSDRRDAISYFGMHDDPAAYRLEYRNGRVVVRDDHMGTVRAARDHRAETLERWRARVGDRHAALDDERIDAAWKDAAGGAADHRKAKILLRALLPVLAEVNPASAAVLLFAHGMVGIHHAFRMHRVARDLEASDEAREILHEIHERVDRLDPEHAEAMMELLAKEYRR